MLKYLLGQPVGRKSSMMRPFFTKGKMASKVSPDPTSEVVKYEPAPGLDGPQPLPTRAVAFGPSGVGKGVLLSWLITSPEA